MKRLCGLLFLLLSTAAYATQPAYQEGAITSGHVIVGGPNNDVQDGGATLAPSKGGLGASNLLGVLYGNGSSAASVLTIGTGLLLSGSTLSATAIAGNAAGSTGQLQYNVGSGVFGGISSTGTGIVVRATNPTLVGPYLGTPLAIVLTNATGMPPAGLAVSTGLQTAMVAGVDVTGGLLIAPTSNCNGANGALQYTSGAVAGCNANVASLTTADQTVSGGANLTSYSIGTALSGSYTIDCGKNPNQFLLNGGAFTLVAPANDGDCYVQVVNGPSAGAIALSGFSLSPSGSGDAFVTTKTINAAAVSVSSSNPAIVTYTNSFVAGQVVYFTAATMPVGMTSGSIYYVLPTGLSTSSFEFSSSPGGTAIGTTSTGTTVVITEPSVFALDVFRINGLAAALWKQMQ